MNTQDLIALAEKHGASVTYNDRPAMTVAFSSGALYAFCAALATAQPKADERGSAEPDMRAVCEALGFDPTNHHNAAKCPYCREQRAKPLPELVVTRDGKVLTDQRRGLQEFKERCGIGREPLVRIDPQGGVGREPCGECHLQPGETCDICGAKNG